MKKDTPLIRLIPTAELIPYARNAKKHDEAQVAKIAGSIREFGFNNPVLIAPDKTIIAGHGRVLAAIKLNRWQAFTGKPATNEATGKTFDSTKEKMLGK